MLWSFLPWIIFFLLGLVVAIRQIISKRFILTNKEEAITISGFLITYLALGSSKVQLPHYIFVVFPLAAIITANFFEKLFEGNALEKWRTPLLIFHQVVFALLWIALIALMWIPFDTIPRVVAVTAGVGFLVFLWLSFKKQLRYPRLLLLCLYTSIGLNIFLNAAFYPALLQYQLGNLAANFIKDKKLPKEKVFVYGRVTDARNSLYFYGDYFFKKISNAGSLKAGDYILTSGEEYPQLMKEKKTQVVYTGNAFNVTKLSLKFLTPSKRAAELIPFYVVKVID
jgi:hypothetical protein